ncbi:MAG TPA: GlxA family transcriptional regulator [Casimicrobiaceae bacterium]|nr:GlxA family transcriptional regulator [Casimicrobiaceae bacterium]
MMRSTQSRAEPRATKRSRAPAFTVGFYLLPQFPMLAFASAIEPLRAANRLSGERLFEWLLASEDGRPVKASNGIEVSVHAACGDDIGVNLLLACSGSRSERDAASSKWLRHLARKGAALGGVSLGPYVLAHAGLLDGRRCTLHWESLAAFADRFPRTRTTAEIYVIDGDRYTCSGGTSGLDMMLALITEHAGRPLATAVSEQFIHPRIRGTHDPQRMAVQSRLGVANPRLIEAISLMETPHDDAKAVAHIAAEVGLSARQLERLFARYLATSPSHYYLGVRLQRARTLLQQTPRPILDVAVACGFASASHFSRCYRAAFGHRPSEERTAILSPSGA